MAEAGNAGLSEEGDPVLEPVMWRLPDFKKPARKPCLGTVLLVFSRPEVRLFDWSEMKLPATSRGFDQLVRAQLQKCNQLVLPFQIRNNLELFARRTLGSRLYWLGIDFIHCFQHRSILWPTSNGIWASDLTIQRVSMRFQKVASAISPRPDGRITVSPTDPGKY